MHFAANTFPGQPKAINDNTHFNNYGAYEIARIIVHGIREDKLRLTKFLDPSVPDFNPAKPDAFSTFHLPYTPMQKKEDTDQGAADLACECSPTNVSGVRLFVQKRSVEFHGLLGDSRPAEDGFYPAAPCRAESFR